MEHPLEAIDFEPRKDQISANDMLGETAHFLALDASMRSERHSFQGSGASALTLGSAAESRQTEIQQFRSSILVCTISKLGRMQRFPDSCPTQVSCPFNVRFSGRGRNVKYGRVS